MRFKSVVYRTMLGFMMVSVSLFAHHGTGSSYDMRKTIVVKGVITEFAYTNHIPNSIST
jgi:hypothetical protein